MNNQENLSLSNAPDQLAHLPIIEGDILERSNISTSRSIRLESNASFHSKRSSEKSYESGINSVVQDSSNVNGEHLKIGDYFSIPESTPVGIDPPIGFNDDTLTPLYAVSRDQLKRKRLSSEGLPPSKRTHHGSTLSETNHASSLHESHEATASHSFSSPASIKVTQSSPSLPHSSILQDSIQQLSQASPYILPSVNSHLSHSSPKSPLFWKRQRQRLNSSSYLPASPASRHGLPFEPSEEEQSRILRLSFEDHSIGLIIAEFLKSSEIRCLIYVLQLKGHPVSRTLIDLKILALPIGPYYFLNSFQVAGFYEMLCRRNLMQQELSELIAEYLGILFFQQSHTKREQKSIDNNDEDIEFIGASFQPFILNDSQIWDSPIQRASALPPYKLIYEVEVFGRYCDECNRVLDIPKKFQVDFVTVNQNGLLLLPPSAIDDMSGSIVKEEITGIERLVDRSITNVVLCPNCSVQFIERESLEPIIHQLTTSVPILLHCQFINDVILPHYDHGMKSRR